MKNQISSAAATYGPQCGKTFEGALFAFLTEECPQLGGDRTRKQLVQFFVELVHQFFPETTHLRQGQMPWVCVHKDEKSSYGKSIDKSNLTSVYLSLVGSCDAKERAEGTKLRDLKKDAVARLCKEAYEQDGCLSLAELAIMLKIAPATASKYISEWEMEAGEVLPRRGTIHDMGPTLTHKKIIIQKLFMEQKTVQQTSRETFHSYQAIYRYISSFKRTLLCVKKGLSKEEIATATGHSQRLIQQYLDIIEEFSGQGKLIEEIEQYDPKIEAHYDAHPPNIKLPSEIPSSLR